MIKIGTFFFKYRNLVFPIFGLMIFIPSPRLFTPEQFGPGYFNIPMVTGLLIALCGQVIRALTIGLRYIVRGGKNKEVYADDLVTDGFFRHCRNPLYVGNIMMLLGVGILSNSLFFLAFIVPLFCFIYQAIVLAEENYLSMKFGDKYEAYKQQTRRWLPEMSGLMNTIRSMRFNWIRYVLSEYNTVYMLFLSIAIVMISFNPDLLALPRLLRFQLFGVTISLLTAVYLFVRYLKKSKRLLIKAD